jgi:hypothetical protein
MDELTDASGEAWGRYDGQCAACDFLGRVNDWASAKNARESWNATWFASRTGTTPLTQSATLHRLSGLPLTTEKSCAARSLRSMEKLLSS